MELFTCSTCGKEWPENYCPECASTIDRSRATQHPPKIAAEPAASPTFHALNMVVQPASHRPPPVPPAVDGRPSVVVLYRIWCGFLLLVYLGLGVREALILTGRIQPSIGPIAGLLSSDDPKLRAELLEEERQNSVVGIGLALVGAVLFATGMAYCPRASWAWRWGVGAIIVSVFPLCLTLAGAIPLLIFWFKPETKHYFRHK